MNLESSMLIQRPPPSPAALEQSERMLNALSEQRRPNESELPFTYSNVKIGTRKRKTSTIESIIFYGFICLILYLFYRHEVNTQELDSSLSYVPSDFKRPSNIVKPGDNKHGEPRPIKRPTLHFVKPSPTPLSRPIQLNAVDPFTTSDISTDEEGWTTYNDNLPLENSNEEILPPTLAQSLISYTDIAYWIASGRLPPSSRFWSEWWQGSLEGTIVCFNLMEILGRSENCTVAFTWTNGTDEKLNQWKNLFERDSVRRVGMSSNRFR